LRHRIIFLVTSVLLGVGACASPMASPTGPHLVDGNWGTAPAVPSGSGIHLSLATNGPIVTGTGQQYAIQYLKDSFTITGRQSTDGTSFSLTFTSDSGTVATHSGHMVGLDEFRLSERAPCSTTGCAPDSLTFVREPS
jgi:hypothetical protein